jgi:hypothetical protein
MVGAVDLSLQPFFFWGTLHFIKVHICNSATPDCTDLLQCLCKTLSILLYSIRFKLEVILVLFQVKSYLNFNQPCKKNN